MQHKVGKVGYGSLNGVIRSVWGGMVFVQRVIRSLWGGFCGV